MSSPIDRALMNLAEHSVQERGVVTAPLSKLQVNVIFTSTRGTLAALRTASALAHNLEARVNLLAPQVVPYALPLERPPVPITFTQQRLLDLVYRGNLGCVEASVQLYLCRDRRQALQQVLKPRSLVIIGGRARWWPTTESKLAGILRSQGHQVIFVDQR